MGARIEAFAERNEAVPAIRRTTHLRVAPQSVQHVPVDEITRGENVGGPNACRRVSQESVQLHGGMGMTDELKVSHTFRRLTMIAQQFGDAEHHLERFASLGP